MRKPDDMTPEEWEAFGKAAREQHVNPNDSPDDVEPWLAIWRRGVAFGKLR